MHQILNPATHWRPKILKSTVGQSIRPPTLPSGCFIASHSSPDSKFRPSTFPSGCFIAPPLPLRLQSVRPPTLPSGCFVAPPFPSGFTALGRHRHPCGGRLFHKRLVATGRRRSQTTWKLVAIGRRRSQVCCDQPCDLLQPGGVATNLPLHVCCRQRIQTCQKLCCTTRIQI